MNSTSIKENETNSSLDVPIKAINHPPGFPETKSKELPNEKEEKHHDFHPMHCHHMQPMQSATTVLITETPPNHAQEDSKK